jgi:hypothetical protein
MSSQDKRATGQGVGPQIGPATRPLILVKHNKPEIQKMIKQSREIFRKQIESKHDVEDLLRGIYLENNSSEGGSKKRKSTTTKRKSTTTKRKSTTTKRKSTTTKRKSTKH